MGQLAQRHFHFTEKFSVVLIYIFTEEASRKI